MLKLTDPTALAALETIKTGTGPFTIQTPNSEFTGKRAGVFFDNGIAVVRDVAKRDEFVNQFHYNDITAERNLAVQ